MLNQGQIDLKKHLFQINMLNQGQIDLKKHLFQISISYVKNGLCKIVSTCCTLVFSNYVK
jgi:hypothetical protein